MQVEIVSHALDLLEAARLPRTTVQTPLIWDTDDSWKAGYARVDEASAERLRAAGEARRSAQEASKAADS